MDGLKIQEYINKQIALWKKDKEIFAILSHSEKKKNEKNKKTNDRRNELRSENGKKTKRWSKGKYHDSGVTNNIYLKDIFLLKDRINKKLEEAMKNWNIIDLFRSYWVEIRETYNNYRWLCPFHKENTPSFSISKTKLIAKCFGCGKWYQLITMLFVLKFWEETTKKRWRFEKLEEDIDRFL